MTVIDPYQSLQDELKEQKSDLQAAEVHGMMTGWLCIKSPKKNDWEYSLFPDLDISPTFRHIFEGIYKQLCSDNLLFNILISSDDTPLTQQAEDLAFWSRGFLLGLGLGGFQTETDEILNEAINDLRQISHIDFQGIIDNNENEQDLSELIEFVRTAVMIIFNTLHIEKENQTHH